MLTGVETAGIVLAVFPLCIELVKLYASGAGTIYEMRHHHKVLREFHRELEMESCKFYNCLLNLFEDTITEKDCNRLFHDLRGAEQRLKARLNRPHAAVNFINAVIAMNEELADLQQSFANLDERVADKITGQRMQVGSGEYVKLCKRAGKKLKKRFMLALLKTEHMERIQRIRNINDDLDKLVNGARQCAVNINATKADISAIGNYYKRVRDSAQSIFNVLKKRVQTPHHCEDHEHSASLCLEIRNPGLKPRAMRLDDRSTAATGHSTLQFKIVFCVTEATLEDATPKPEPTWKELEVGHIEGGDEDGEEQNDEPHRRLVPLICAEDDLNTSELVPAPWKLAGERTKQTILVEHGLPRAKALDHRPTTPTELVRFVETVTTKFTQKLLGHSRSVSFAGRTEDIYSQPPSRQPTPNPRNCDIAAPIRQVKKDSRGDNLSDAEVRVIHDLCMTVKESATSRQCLGLLRDDSAQKYHRVWSMPVGGCFGIADKLQFSTLLLGPISLRTLLETTRSHKLPMKDRLSLGVKLASSVIQLQQTWWLNDLPMVMHNLSSTLALIQPQPRGVACRKNKVLFSLGIVLLELWFWRRLEEFSKDAADLESKSDYIQWSDVKIWGTAALAFKDLDDDAPTKYSDAVRTCFFDNIPTEGREFTTRVWEKVVRPLEDNLLSYVGDKSLGSSLC
ncbi:hypothetical protein BDZ91DRAFT_747764 [Kalaharituber pfeilii]|nr:hypothetical protein BDZ91DRAFT_747764 [Kalaharituber pfeilii]